MKIEVSQLYIDVISNIFRTKHHGRGNAVQYEKLLFDLSASGIAKITDRSFREVVAIIRRDDLLKLGFIISCSGTGYWLSTDKKELKEFLDQEMDRWSNQYGNLKLLHLRIQDKGEQATNQPTLFG